MSGLIDSAGSRSGVLGTTELDYEEGDFTPTSNTSTSAVYGHYVKVGNVAHIWAKWEFDATGASATLTGLPFTSGSFAGPKAGILITTNVNWSANMTSVTGYVGVSGTVFYPLMSGDNVAWADGFSVVSGSSVILQLTYNTA